ncbi:GNAT family N-acetyltransferase [Streptomyces sp. NPDC094472]|uniref:GNAT family N-acetyltransferase n=1 Tax=Streptomyces sp. NPDC094472 TaxID=3155080 RepID=UPI003325D392
MRLRIEAEHWLARAGIDQWRTAGFRDRALEKWRIDIENGRTWIIVESGEAVGTVTLAAPDMDFWTRADHPDAALYVAKLITSRAASGQNLGGRILDWVGAMAAKADKPWIRLDCWRSNTALQDYYLREGFRHVRTEAPPHRLSGWMAQRSSSVIMHPEHPLREVEPLSLCTTAEPSITATHGQRLPGDTAAPGIPNAPSEE